MTSELVDAVLRFSLTAGALAAGMVLPNALVAIEKPLGKYFKHLDRKQREREAQRIIRYMKYQGLLVGDYEFGLQISKKGKKRLEELDFDSLKIPTPTRWDHLWRLVFYDIPEHHKLGRDTLTAKLRELGFFQLQRSVWIHPFPCREVIEKVTSAYMLEPYVSYIETRHLDNQAVLIKRFNKRIPTVSFK